MDQTGMKGFLEDGKNKEVVKCKYCGSKILQKKSANYIVQSFELPLIQQENNHSEVQTETIDEFWHISDMYTFENIGFTQTVNNYKYLSCADCDVGPVGYHNLTTKESYVALSRVA